MKPLVCTKLQNVEEVVYVGLYTKVLLWYELIFNDETCQMLCKTVLLCKIF